MNGAVEYLLAGFGIGAVVLGAMIAGALLYAVLRPVIHRLVRRIRR